jgi:hypothetical protein
MGDPIKDKKAKLKLIEKKRKEHLATARQFKTPAEKDAWTKERIKWDNALVKEKERLGIPLSKTSSGKSFTTTKEGASKHTRPVSKKAMEKSEDINIANKWKGAAALDYTQPMSNKTIDRYNKIYNKNK